MQVSRTYTSASLDHLKKLVGDERNVNNQSRMQGEEIYCRKGIVVRQEDKASFIIQDVLTKEAFTMRLSGKQRMYCVVELGQVVYVTYWKSRGVGRMITTTDIKMDESHGLSRRIGELDEEHRALEG